MKKAACVAGVLALLMLVPLFFTYMGAGFNQGHTEKTYFSEAQINEICDQLQFKLAPGETLTTVYWPGVLQSPTSLGVYIHGIESEEAFMSRFSGKIASGNVFFIYGEFVSGNDLELFSFDGHKPKDFGSLLVFTEAEGVQTAEFHIFGYVPQLSTIYDFVYDPYHAFFSYPPFIICLILEIIIVLFFLVQVVILAIRQKQIQEVHPL